MKPVALLSAAALVAALAPVSAAPDDKETTERVSYTDRTERDPAPEATDGWVELASPTPASHRREYITVDEHAGPYTRLRIAADAGRPMIRRIRIQFADGSERVVRIGRKLTRRSRPAYVDLRGPKQLEQIVVETAGSRKATYSVHAEHVRGAVATR